MARRKGSARGKSTVNSRSKSAVENAREKLRDDPGGTKSQQPQSAVTNLSNMEATTTAKTTTATTTKYYNKTKLQQNNNHQQQQQQQNKSTTATTTNSKKTQQQQTYRDLEESQESNKKLTAKQAKQAAKLAALQQQQQQQNVKSDTNNPQRQKEVSKTMTASSIAEKETSSSSAKHVSKTIPATTNLKTTIASAAATTIANTTANNANVATTTNHRSSSSSNNNYVNNISNSSNFNKSDSSLNNNNSSSNSKQHNISDNVQHQQQSQQQQQQKEQPQNSTSDNSSIADNSNVSSSAAWNNSKYLHKKFKRLASTTENDVLQEAEKLRTTSMSSASSSVSSPPPPAAAAATPTPVQQQQQQPLPPTSQPEIQPPQLKHPILNSFKDDNSSNHRLTNGYSSKHDATMESNLLFQNQVLLQLAQQQQSQQTSQQHQKLVHTSAPTNHIEVEVTATSSAPTSATTLSASATAGGSGAGGGRYICPYCNLSCAKPSVLEKHIRAHTNERPYPCDICDIAFKTKSNLYKHCRSRSHAARQKGIEVPPDADDGLSDQDVDPELSNSSSEMLSRTGTPTEGLTISQLPAEPHTLIPTPMNSASSTAASPLPSTSPAATKNAYLQQPSQQQMQMPLGTPAVGTLPPATNAHNNYSSNNSDLIAVQKQAIDLKPYKPKFHNASLYASPKEAAAAAAAAAANSNTQPSAMPPTSKEVILLLQPPQHQSPSPSQHQQTPAPTQKSTEPSMASLYQHQQLLMEAQKLATAHASSAQTVHLPPQPSPTHMSTMHHPSLSPSTQMKLNNHISTHQLQQLQQQQLQQLQQQSPAHLLLGPPPQGNVMPLPLAAYYLQPPPGTPTALMHSPAHHPGQAFYNPVAFASMHLTPQQQQQFHQQLQLQQQHLHQHQQQLQQIQQQLHSAATTIPQPPPQQTPPHMTQPAAPPSPAQTHIKTPTPVGGGNMSQTTASNARNNVHHPKPSTPTNIVHTATQSPLHYLANAASAASALNAQQAPPPNNKITIDVGEQHVASANQRSNTNLLQSSNNAVGNMGEVTLNKEKLHEHINKIISQNEAIVENKELLLQKKYPKTLNRSRSFNNTNNGNSSNSSNNSQTLQSTTGGPPSESPTNAKLAQVIVQKQQQQQQQLQQQQYMYQQQQQQQQQMHLQQQKQRHMFNEKPNMDENAPLPLNGTSKHLLPKHMQQQHLQLQTNPSQQNSLTNNQQNHSGQMQQYRSIVNNTAHQQSQHQQPPATMSTQNSPSTSSNTMANVPLNLSSKSKPSIVSEERLDLSTKQPQGPLPQQPPPATPRKRHSVEHNQHNVAQNPLIHAATVNEASNSSNSSSLTPQPSTSSTSKYPPNNSIIKNLLLNARGLAVPMGEGDDAVYRCPLCAMEFRTAEDLQLHNSSYCQGSISSANSPASSPSHKYFRSNSMAFNISDLKILSKNPLSLVKLAWSQLKTKPSNLVLDRLSASLANSSKNSSTTTTSATSTQPSSTVTNASSTAASNANTTATVAVTKSQLAINELPLRFVDAPLPSPGPLLGKTALVDYSANESKHKSEEVIITKMHDDRMYHNHLNEHHTANKRIKFDAVEKFTTKRLTNITSGGDMQPLNAQELSKKEERLRRFTSSGGCMIPLSECDDLDKSPKMIRTPLLSGGSFQEVSPKKETKMPMPLMPNAQLTPKLSLGLVVSSTAPQHFQFPPINQITAFNPLTLALTEKVIPYVPGIPGPNSLTPQMPLPIPTITANLQLTGIATNQQHLQLPPAGNHLTRTVSPNRKQSLSPMNMVASENVGNKAVATFGGVQNVPSEFAKAPPSANMRNVRNWNATTSSVIPSKTATPTEPKSLKTFNFLRIADNLSPRKTLENKPPTEAETRHFNLERVAKEQLIIQQPSGNKLTTIAVTTLSPLHVDTCSITSVSIETLELPGNGDNKTKSKFLRPTSLPLRPGTFTPKRHHGITPTANTLPLISPETPRPSKECVQLYLNGNSYTYLGLKSSTKTFYCTLNCPQPSYVQDMHKLSMYSMWQQCAENNPHPLGLKPKEVMSLYDSRQRMTVYNMAESQKLAFTLVAAQQSVMTPFHSTEDKFYHHKLKPIALAESSTTQESTSNAETKDGNTRDLACSSSSSTSTTSAAAAAATLVGGYESNENYTYIRGRGRGKYVCSECGIRCKKPSMLKKHIRTHTDVRPYTCKHCNFSFKTKGNLTKHMQSKTHYKKCIELGLNPGPMPADGEFLEPDMEFDQQSSTSAGGRTSSMGNAESDSEGDSSDNETESSNESDSPRSNAPMASMNVSAAEDNKSHLEHEAARCLLSLSMTPPIHTQSITDQQSGVIVTTVLASSAISTATTQAIRRVISYTSPKPPFDYHKQEQYYSNPEESKPKNINAATTNFEAAPMDLTKPRGNDNAVETLTQVTLSHANVRPIASPNNHASLASMPGPVQTKAQIHDVIFGGNKNESGLLKTMISVSSIVGRSQQGISEEVRSLNEDMMLYDYRREQTLKYNQIKQIQLCRGMTSTANDVNYSAASLYPTTVVTTTLSQASTSMVSLSSSVVSTASTESVKMTACIIESKKELPVQLPKIEIIEPVVEVAIRKAEIVLAPLVTDIQKPLKSSDESEETDEEPPAKRSLVNHDDKSCHNSNLPSAILQPGTTDFSGVLSGGSNSSASTQPTRTVIVGEDGLPTTNNNAEILSVHTRAPPITNADGRPLCSICSKTFQKQSQLALHMNIHYMERKYKCDPCGVSFRTQGHLQKHERSEAHKNKVIMTSTFGVPTTSNPRPFECTDCKIAFRIHGHLAKHLRSKTHVQKLECLQKLPFGTYAEIERAGISLTEIDTSDCENSLISLRLLAQKLIEKDPSSKLGSYTTPSGDQDNNSNTGLVSQDSASEDGFQAAASAAASAIASLDNDSAANTPRRTNSTSEDESIALALNNNLKRRMPGSFSNGEESDKEYSESQHQDKRMRPDITVHHLNSASPTAN